MYKITLMNSPGLFVDRGGEEEMWKDEEDDEDEDGIEE